ncbi:MAG TPA: hypothetical protein VN442_19425 [Bryobacteraceae bacterium]|nr:hypothetical protein [Bryobacteraceae bacterium]
MRAIILCFILTAAPAMAQQFSAGVKAGGQLLDDIDSYWGASESKHWVAGATVEIALPFRLAVEVDAWDFPVLLKYRPGRLFISGGYAASLTGSTITSPITARTTAPWRGPGWNSGAGACTSPLNSAIPAGRTSR